MSTRLNKRRGATRRPAQRKKREALAGYAFIAPGFIGLAALYLIPLINTFITSFSETGPFGGREFAGIDNYSTLASDEMFWQALRNSLIYTGIVLLGIPVAIVIAALIHSVKRFRGTYRVLFFLPVVTLPVAVGMVWRYLYNGDFGLINQILSMFGIDGPSWVANPETAIYAISIVGIWMTFGINIIILGAGLQGIPPDLYEAASLDGAGGVRQFFSITLRLLSPSIFLVSVLSMISSLQQFDLIYVMLSKGSQAEQSSQTIVYMFFQKAFVEYNQGYGAAIAVVLLTLIMIATAIQFRLQRKWVFYE